MIGSFELLDDFARSAGSARPLAAPRRPRVPPRNQIGSTLTSPGFNAGGNVFDRIKAYMESKDIAGSLRVNASDGKLFDVYSRGDARRVISAKKYPPAPLAWSEHTRFDVGSISKMVTTMLLLQFMELGYVDLDDSIANELPGFMNYQGYLAAGNSDVTYRHLLQHRTGWANANKDVKSVMEVDEYVDFFTNSGNYGGAPFKTLANVGVGTYGNTNFSIQRILIPLLTFKSAQVAPGSKEEFWAAFDDLPLDKRYVAYNWWVSFGFKKLSIYVGQPVGLGPLIAAGDPALDAAGYGPEYPEGLVLWDVSQKTGAYGMRYSSWELGELLSGLRTAKILNKSTVALTLDPTTDEPLAGRLGWSYQKTTDLGDCFGHGGDGYGTTNVFMYMPDGVTLALLANRKGADDNWGSNELFYDIVDLWLEATADGDTI